MLVVCFGVSKRAFPEVKRPGRVVEHLSHVASTLKKEYSYASIPLLGLRGLF